MRVVPKNEAVVAGILAAFMCGFLLTIALPASSLGPKFGAVAGGPAVSPFALMKKAPRDLPVEHYDAI
jgi:hypothetical protein